MSDGPLSIPLARHLLDRDADSRSRDGLLESLLADPITRVIAVHRGRALLSGEGEGADQGADDGAAAVAAPALALLDPDAATGAEQYLYLGRSTDGPRAGTPLVAAIVGDEVAARIEPDPARWATLRAAAPLLSDSDAGLFAEIASVANWHASHGFCPRCGTATIPQQAGWVRHCPKDDIDIFPRTDPAVIVLITDADDRVLLGSNATWTPGRYSLLAGFVEPGESLEHAVIREMKEESGVDVVDPVYRGSQPWPFPASIMLGFHARLSDAQDPESLVPDGVEIVDLRWLTREQLASPGSGVLLPGAASIARALLEDWYGGPIPDHEGRW
ncbi:NAD(+) diphosphatase [Orlajensenia leifsoniae]|uniref:NAD(+) diphosphatase n=1 Tax=Orlajensenia leifsoniae TaxID=2561933 RepID=UPI001F008A1E|nr:NAD(+) diphosphatase [Leifsonia flava]